jgi:hypothetical protein
MKNIKMRWSVLMSFMGRGGGGWVQKHFYNGSICHSLKDKAIEIIKL